VSAWDFNMESMRLQADLEHLPPVSEEMELMLSHSSSTTSKLPVVKEEGAASELKRQPTKTKGRFDVYEEDDYGTHTPPPRVAQVVAHACVFRRHSVGMQRSVPQASHRGTPGLRTSTQPSYAVPRPAQRTHASGPVKCGARCLRQLH
jgi:hypothetical protein